MKERGQGRPDQKSAGQRNNHLKEQGKALSGFSNPQPEQKAHSGGIKSPELASQKNAQLKEAGQAYSATLSSIRADQDVETFVADLRQNKVQLLSLAQELMRNRGNTREERNAYVSVGGYLDVVLKEYIFDLDPYAIKRPGDEELVQFKEALDFDLLTRAGTRWLKTHPDSKAAKEVSEFGLFAFSGQHKRLLQEMWPAIRVVARHSLKRK